MSDKKPKQRPRLMIVDDDAGLRRQLRWAFDDYKPVECGDRQSAVAAAKKDPPAVVLLDLGLPPDPDGPSEGLATLDALLDITPEAKIIVLTGQKEREYALECVARGAYDFYQKPPEVDELRLIVQRAAALHALEAENRALQETRAGASGIAGLTYSNAAMQNVVAQVKRFARADVSVLLTGESGTGKEVLARALHDFGTRAQAPFIAINCAAIPENLLESELFGYEKGAFTGAHKTTVGKIEQAQGGTLLLDEIGDLPGALQAKLLRVLQERKIERIGGRRAIPVDFRLVAATNKDIEAMAGEGTFREDLFYRIGETTIRIPPLRERPEDAILIAQKFLQEWRDEQGVKVSGFTSDALVAISQAPWRGNVRELQSRIKRAALCADGRISAQDLDLDLTATPERPARTLKEARQQAEFDALQDAMSEAEGNISEAARLLGVSRPTLYQLLDEHNLREK